MQIRVQSNNMTKHNLFTLKIFDTFSKKLFQKSKHSNIIMHDFVFSNSLK